MTTWTGGRRVVMPTMDSIIAGPLTEPLDIEEVKKQRRVSTTVTSLDTLFDLWISAARQGFEAQTGRQAITATRELWLPAAPIESEIELPYPPLQSVVGVFYDDDNGNEVAFDASNYTVIAPQGDYCARGRIALLSGGSWPALSAMHPKALRIRFICGYGDAPGDVPELVKAAMMFLVGHFHRFGEEVQEGVLTHLPLGAKMLFDGFKYTALPTLPPTRWSCQA
jgi:uncharacterized phiE125 gp8 family phage protein